MPSQNLQDPTDKEKKPLDLLITTPQFALILVDFLKNPLREKLVIDDSEYDRLAITNALWGWAGRNLSNFFPEAFPFDDRRRLDSLNRLSQLIFDSLYQKIEGSVVPEHLKQLVDEYTAQQNKNPKGVKTEELNKLSVKKMVELATRAQKRIREAAYPNAYAQFPEAGQKINEQVFEKIVNHYLEKGQPPETAVLEQIVKEVVKGSEAELFFGGKIEVNGQKVTRISVVAEGLFSVSKDPVFKNAAATYQELRNATDLQYGTREELTKILQNWGFEPSQILEILNHLETLHPNMPLEVFRKDIESFVRIKGLSSKQEGQIISNIRSLKRYVELSPNICHESSIFLASSESEANKLGLSVKVLSAFGLGLTETRIDQELLRKDLSPLEKANLRALKQGLKEAREKTGITDPSQNIDPRIKKHKYWDIPKGFYFYGRPPSIPPLEKPAAAFFQKLSRPVQTVIRKSILRGLGTIKFGRMPGLKKLGYFQPSTWKKKARWWFAKRIVGGLLIASGKNLLGKLGATIIKNGFREAFFKGLAFIFRRAAQYAAKKMASSVLWRLAAWFLGAIAANLIPGIGQIVSVILVAAGVLDFVVSAVKLVKELLFGKPKSLLEGDVSEAAAKLISSPLGLFKGLSSFLRPPKEVGPMIKPAEDTLKAFSVAAIVLILGLIILFNVILPLSPAFVALYSGYKTYKGFQGLLASNVEKAINAAKALEALGKITFDKIFPGGTAEASNDEFYNYLTAELGFSETEAQTIIENTRKYGHLQCVILATSLFNTMHPETPLPVLENPKAYYDSLPSGFRNPTSVDEIGPGTAVVVPPTNCPTGDTCQANIKCCGHMYIIIDVKGNEIVTAHAEGSTGQVYIKNLPHPKILESVDLKKYILPDENQ